MNAVLHRALLVRQHLLIGLFLILAQGCAVNRGDDGSTTDQKGSTSPGEHASQNPRTLGLAPHFVLPTLEGARFDLREHAGGVVLLNFWATWCAPCLQEMPALVELYSEYRNRGLSLVGISVDEDGAAVVREFVDRLGVNYPIALDDGTVGAAYKGNLVIPSTFVVDRRGHIRSRYIGIVDFDTLVPVVERLLAEDGPD